MKMNESDVEAIAKILGSLTVGAIIVCAIKFAFGLTWPQGFVLGWLYCLLKDSIENPNK
jgi:hypothetical protein